MKMVSVQERLKLKRAQIDTWSIREQLCLASAVLRSGDQNWMSVSRSLKLFGDGGRPVDWFSQKSCAVQYSNLLENVETPKRKKRTDKGEASLETPSESIARRLTEERIEELKKLLNEDRQTYAKLKEDVLKVRTGVADDKLSDMCQEIEDENQHKIKRNEAHERWLKERDEKKIELERAWKPPVGAFSQNKRKHHPRLHRHNSNNSERNSEVDCVLDRPISEPLNVDIVSEENVHEAAIEAKPSQTPTSPLLTSLLKSPSPATASQGSSILHSAITSHRGASPTISSLLSSAPGVSCVGSVSVAPPTTVSSSLKNLVSSAINAEKQHHQLPSLKPSPAAGAPTLSMLLELPPSLPGKPLPELPSVVKTTAKSPSTVSAVVSAASTEASTSVNNIPVTPITSTTSSNVTVKNIDSSITDRVPTPLSADLKFADSTINNVILPVTPTQSSVDSHLLAHDKEDLIEEVLIEEIVVNEGSVITSGLLPPQITDVVVATDRGDVKIEECRKEDLKLEKFIEVSQSTDVFALPKVETKFEESTTVDSSSNKSTLLGNKEVSVVKVKRNKEHCTLIENTSQQIIAEINDEASLAIVPDVELTPGTVAEVIEITEDQESNIQTEEIDDCEPCIQELENMEVIILDKMQEIDDVQIVENMKELGCEVVELVMGNQDKAQDLKEGKDGVVYDSIKSEVPCTNACSIISKSTKEVSNPENQSKNDNYILENSANQDIQTLFDISASVSLGVLKTDKSKDCTKNIDEKCNDKDKKPDVMGDVCQKKAENKFVEERQCPRDDIAISVAAVQSMKTEGIAKIHSDNLNQDVPHSIDDECVRFNNLSETTKEDQCSVTSVQADSLSHASRGGISEFHDQGNDFPQCVTGQKLKPTSNGSVEPQKTVKKHSSFSKENLQIPFKQTVSKVQSLDRKYVSTNVSCQDNSAIPENGEEVKLCVDKEGKDTLLESETIILAESKEENMFCKDSLEKECPKDVENKKIDTEYTSIEETENVSGSFRIESQTIEINTNYSATTSKKNLSFIGPSEKEMSHSNIKKTNLSKDLMKGFSVPMKDNAVAMRDSVILKKEFPLSDEPLNAGKQDVKRENIEEVLKREGIKCGSTKDDERENDEKKPFNKDFAKSQRNQMWAENKPKVSVLETRSILEIGNENFLHNSVGNVNEVEYVPGEKNEKPKNIYELHQQNEETSTDYKMKKKSVCDRISSIITLKEGKEYKRGNDMKLDSIDIIDEKSERRISLRAETPSTEDDKTNDAEPQKIFGRKRLTAISAIDSVPNSPASTTDEEREYKSWKKSIMLLYGRLATHKFASLFLRPITDDQAPGYSSIVHRPIDLLAIKKNIETGIIRTTLEFQRDVMLMFLNSIMYNKSSHFVHKMALQMQSEGMQHIQDYLTTQMLVQVAGDGVPIRRETRTTEANKQREMLTNPSPCVSQEESECTQVHKRKRATGFESERNIKKKRVDE